MSSSSESESSSNDSCKTDLPNKLMSITTANNFDNKCTFIEEEGHPLFYSQVICFGPNNTKINTVQNTGNLISFLNSSLNTRIFMFL